MVVSTYCNSNGLHPSSDGLQPRMRFRALPDFTPVLHRKTYRHCDYTGPKVTTVTTVTRQQVHPSSTMQLKTMAHHHSGLHRVR